ncbi:hypothetical protein G6F57_002294 [Rhizopus arrhizus]|nr:hypothetical protein G6F22_009650 [Rhizopus arrhizus]KAG1416841.1 hypothetical protein G6F58_005784 [Rhizopus delemar]KAG0795127.1 hypothetical protein G6F21_002347 [Rhizopus arrhizus]KAG0816442.1 hypothetical protein G6F20_003205 [Rhizopus arrhizus]KAG0838134.1 hypothetical protein G6F19_003312 [Rhizopus arrhizus]
MQQLHADLTVTRAEIRKLQQENASLRKRLTWKPQTIDTSPCPSGRTISSAFSALPHNPVVPSKRPPSPNNTFLLCLRFLSLNVMLPNLAQLQLPGNYLHLLNKLTLNSSMYLLDAAFLYNQCALTFVDYTSTPVEF